MIIIHDIEVCDLWREAQAFFTSSLHSNFLKIIITLI